MTVIREPQRIVIGYSADGSRYATTISADDEVMPKAIHANGRVYTTIMFMKVTTERTRFAAQWVKGAA